MQEIFDAQKKNSSNVQTFPISSFDLEKVPKPEELVNSSQDIKEIKDDLPGRNPLSYSEVLRNHECSVNSLDSFAVLPEHTSSSILLDNEKIILVLRQHWFVFLPAILGAIVLLVLPLILNTAPFFSSDIWGANKIFLWLFWYMIAAGLLLQAAVIWFFNVYIITDERIIDVNFSSILASDISIAKIDSIQDHSIKTSGFLETIFGYGTVTIQTAAEKNEFAFEKIPEPEKVNKLLGELINEEEREKIEGRIN